MERILLPLLMTIILQVSSVEATVRPLGRYYKLVPESEAHLISGQAHDLDLPADSMKVLVWNIKKASMLSWSSEFLSMGKKKDLFLVQEAYERPEFIETLSTFKDIRWDFGISFLYKIYNNQATGNMIGSNVDPSEVLVKHTWDWEPIVETPKATVYAKYPVQGTDKKLLVISVHGINITSYGAFTRHMAQIEEQISKHDGPVLFAGDFNTRTAGRTNFLFAMTKRLGFETINFKNGEYRMKFKFTPNYLDHAFVRGLKVKNAEVLKDSNGSDHKPMQLELALAP